MSNPVISVRLYTLVYVTLLTVTLFTWLVGAGGYHGQAASLLVLALALFKGFLIGDFFMGLKQVSSNWRWIILIWLTIPGALISWAFFMSS